MIHTSPKLIEAGMINEFGIANSCLFFSDSVYQMSAKSIYIYEADFNCVLARELYDVEIINEIAVEFCVDLELAEKLLDGTASEWSLDDCDAEKSWWLQGMRGKCAVKMGFDGCEDEDEQGRVYIVPMLGRENELTLIENNGSND